MLYASLVCSGIILAAALLAARYAKHPVGVTVWWAVGVAVVPAFIASFFPAVALQAAILCSGLLLAGAVGCARTLVVPISVTAVAVAYALVATSVTERESRLNELRAQYPFESMEERFPRPIPSSAPGNPELLAQFELGLERAERETAWRSLHIERLHSRTVDRFVNNSGFGVMRMVREGNGNFEKPRPDVPEQPDYFRLTPRGEEKLPARPDDFALGRLHQEGFLDFANPRGFGFVKDRQHVAGFQSHGFSRVPDSAGEWKVASLELVGLLQHDDPVVYLSAKLPRMDELKDAPTRAPDAFESAALVALRAGADLHTGEGSDAARFVGAVRSVKHCVACHGGERGALLGAFSYRLTPVSR